MSLFAIVAVVVAVADMYGRRGCLLLFIPRRFLALCCCCCPCMTLFVVVVGLGACCCSLPWVVVVCSLAAAVNVVCNNCCGVS